MEIKIGVRDVPRELTIETAQASTAVEAAFRKAVADDGLLELTDEKGRKLLIPARVVAYIDLGQEHARTVGFGAV